MTAKIIQITEYLVTVYEPGHPANVPPVLVEEPPTEITFGGQTYDLTSLADEDFEDLYNEVVDYGIDLQETYDAKSLAAQGECADEYERVAECHDLILDAMETEYDRRERNRRRAAAPASLIEIYG